LQRSIDLRADLVVLVVPAEGKDSADKAEVRVSVVLVVQVDLEDQEIKLMLS
jgi:hypothetical protein